MARLVYSIHHQTYSGKWERKINKFSHIVTEKINQSRTKKIK